MALSSDRTLDRIAVQAAPAPAFPYAVEPGHVIYAGAITAATSTGTAVPAGTVADGVTLVAVVGISPRRQDNSGSTDLIGPSIGSGPVAPEHGWFALPFDAAPTPAKLGSPVYAVDDETVSLTETPSGGTARLQVGTLVGFDGTGTAFVKV